MLRRCFETLLVCLISLSLIAANYSAGCCSIKCNCPGEVESEPPQSKHKMKTSHCDELEKSGGSVENEKNPSDHVASHHSSNPGPAIMTCSCGQVPVAHVEYNVIFLESGITPHATLTELEYNYYTNRYPALQNAPETPPPRFA